MVLNRYYPIIGGAENQCRILMNEFKKDNNIKIIGILTHRYDESLEKKTTIDDIPIFRVGKSGNNKLSILSFYFSLFLFLFKKRNDYDILHVHTISLTSFIVVLFSNIFNKKSLQKLTIADEIKDIVGRKGFKGKIFKSLVMYGLNNGNIVTLTNEGMKEVRDYCKNDTNLFKINNGVDKKIFHPIDSIEAKKKYKFNNEYIYFGFVGRLTKVKGILMLCQEFIKFNREYPKSKFRLAIMGSGEFQIDSVEEEIKKLSSKNNCIVLLSSEHQPIGFYNAIDMYISNSTKEGMPNTVLEALSCNKKALLSNIPSHIELLEENKSANISIFNNAKDLNNILFDLYEKFNLEKSILDDKYLIENVAKEYKKLYMEMF